MSDAQEMDSRCDGCRRSFLARQIQGRRGTVHGDPARLGAILSRRCCPANECAHLQYKESWSTLLRYTHGGHQGAMVQTIKDGSVPVLCVERQEAAAMPVVG